MCVCVCTCVCVLCVRVRSGIAIKDGSRDMLIERISCSGLGLVIGSIGASKVQNITFRDAVLPSTVKGIYLKTRWSDSGPVGDDISITDILFENIVMDAPQQYAMYVCAQSLSAFFLCISHFLLPVGCLCRFFGFFQLDRTGTTDG